MSMTTSPAGRAALTKREGSKLKAYKDSVGIWTIGVGHTGCASPPKVTAGMVITSEQCDAMLKSDLAPTEAAVNAALKVPVTQNQYDACVSLAFNIGGHGFAGSTVVHMLNSGRINAAADAFRMWEHPKELVGRRESERTQFLTPDGVTE